METIGSKRSYALTWCMPNNDDDDDDDCSAYLHGTFAVLKEVAIECLYDGHL